MSFKIIAGSYEKILYGISGAFGDEVSLKPIFIFPAHVSAINVLAASPNGGKWLATGSADEIVKVWDLRRRKEIGGLLHHQGSITHLEFPSRSHLLSASEDGTICLFRARDWSVLRSLKGHKGRVNSVAVHPSGKVALSVGKDNMLRMWDFMRGKASTSTRLGKEGEVVRWSTDGLRFAVQSISTIDIYATDMKLQHTITHPSRIHDIKFYTRVLGKGELLLVAAEDKKVSIYDIDNECSTAIIIAELIGHTNRVKALSTLTLALPAPITILSTVSSDGKIHIYNLASLPPPRVGSDSDDAHPIQLEPVAVYDTKGTRLTCVALAEEDSVDLVDSVGNTGKRKRDGKDDGDSDPDGDGDEGERMEEDRGEDRKVGGDRTEDSEGDDEDEDAVASQEEQEGSSDDN